MSDEKKRVLVKVPSFLEVEVFVAGDDDPETAAVNQINADPAYLAYPGLFMDPDRDGEILEDERNAGLE